MNVQGIDKILIAKKLVTWSVSFGVSKIIRAIVENNTTPVKTVDKITIAAGSMALGGLVADKASDYTDEKIDEIIKMVRCVLGEQQTQASPVVIQSEDDIDEQQTQASPVVIQSEDDIDE